MHTLSREFVFNSPESEEYDGLNCEELSNGMIGLAIEKFPGALVEVDQAVQSYYL